MRDDQFNECICDSIDYTEYYALRVEEGWILGKISTAERYT